MNKFKTAVALSALLLAVALPPPIKAADPTNITTYIYSYHLRDTIRESGLNTNATPLRVGTYELDNINHKAWSDYNWYKSDADFLPSPQPCGQWFFYQGYWGYTNGTYTALYTSLDIMNPGTKKVCSASTNVEDIYLPPDNLYEIARFKDLPTWAPSSDGLESSFMEMSLCATNGTFPQYHSREAETVVALDVKGGDWGKAYPVTLSFSAATHSRCLGSDGEDTDWTAIPVLYQSVKLPSWAIADADRKRNVGSVWWNFWTTCQNAMFWLDDFHQRHFGTKFWDPNQTPWGTNYWHVFAVDDGTAERPVEPDVNNGGIFNNPNGKCTVWVRGSQVTPLHVKVYGLGAKDLVHVHFSLAPFGSGTNLVESAPFAFNNDGAVVYTGDCDDFVDAGGSVYFGSAVSTNAMIKPLSDGTATLSIRKADDSGDAPLKAGAITSSGVEAINLPGAANGSETTAFQANIGSDATLGPLSVLFGAYPSATAGSRYGYLRVGDNVGYHSLHLDVSNLQFLGSLTLGGDLLWGSTSTYPKLSADTSNSRLQLLTGDGNGYYSLKAANFYANGNVYVGGGTTASYPMIKQNGAAIDARLADDSGYATINAKDVTANGNISGNGLTLKMGSMSVDTTLADGDYTATIVVTGKTATLPAASGRLGKVYTVKVIAPATSGTLAAHSGDKIEGASTYSLSSSNKFVTVQCAGGTDWWIIGNN